MAEYPPSLLYFAASATLMHMLTASHLVCISLHAACVGVQVRSSAYSALAEYPLDLLEMLEVLPPLQQYAELLLCEADAAALKATQALVGKALQHEHARRRRSVYTQTTEAQVTGDFLQSLCRPDL